jgi:hypothetical protein
MSDEERQKGPFVASEEKTVDGKPVGIEVAGGRSTGSRGRGDVSGGGPGGTTGGATGADHRPPGWEEPGAIDETGELDELGESRRSESPDPILDDDIPASADRDLDSP